MARFYAMNYYKITFNCVNKTSYDVYVKAFDEKDALKIVENKHLYRKVIDLEGNYNIEIISQEEYEANIK